MNNGSMRTRILSRNLFIQRKNNKFRTQSHTILPHINSHPPPQLHTEMPLRSQILSQIENILKMKKVMGDCKAKREKMKSPNLSKMNFLIQRISKRGDGLFQQAQAEKKRMVIKKKGSQYMRRLKKNWQGC